MRSIGLLVFLAWSVFAVAQSDSIQDVSKKKAWVTIRTHPLRLVYGLNAGIDIRLSDRILIGFTYQDHNRDFMAPFADPSNIRLRPVDTSAAAFMMDMQLYFETAQVVFHGPRIALKRITFGTSDWVDDDTGDTYQVWRDQQNWYLSYTAGFRRVDRGFHVMAFATAGAVLFRANEYDSRAAVIENRERVYPFFLVGVGLGWSL